MYLQFAYILSLYYYFISFYTIVTLTIKRNTNASIMSNINDNDNMTPNNEYGNHTPEEYMNRVYHANTTIHNYYGTNPHHYNPPPYNQPPHHHQRMPHQVLPSNIPGLPRNYPFHPQHSNSFPPPHYNPPPYNQFPHHRGNSPHQVVPSNITGLRTNLPSHPELEAVSHPCTTSIMNPSPASDKSENDITNKDTKRKMKNKKRNSLRKAKKAKKGIISIPLLEVIPHNTPTAILNTSPSSSPSPSKESVEKKEMRRKQKNKKINAMQKLKKTKIWEEKQMLKEIIKNKSATIEVPLATKNNPDEVVINMDNSFAMIPEPVNNQTDEVSSIFWCCRK